MEGEARARNVIIEFDSFDQAADGAIVVVEGVE
jgi:hypothetical protein